MALIVHTSFQAAICLFFVQQFWFQIRRRSFSAKQINAIVDMRSNPLSLAALKILSSAFLLFVIALIIFSLTVISVVVPGSLTVVQGNFNQRQDCDVPTMQYPYAPTLLSMDNSSTSVAGTSLPPIQKLAAKVMLLGSYLPPPTPCGTCQYNITFDAPAIQCNITSAFGRRSLTTLRQVTTSSEAVNTTLSSSENVNTTSSGGVNASFSDSTSVSVAVDVSVSPTLDPTALPTPDAIPIKYVVWNATYGFNTTMNLQVAWDMGNFISSTSNLTGPSGVIQCTAYNATYHGSVAHDTAVSTMEVNDVVINNQLVYPGDGSDEMWSMIAIADALATQLQGSVWLHPAGDVAPGSSIIGYGLGTTTGGAESWNWMMNPQLAIPSIMQNISLSMLSGNVGALSNSSTLTTTPQECFVSTLIFQYDSIRLAGTYASTALVTLLCVYLGSWSVKRNKTEESINFSRWMDAVGHQEIVDKIKNKDLNQDTPLWLRRDGRLYLSLKDSG